MTSKMKQVAKVSDLELFPVNYFFQAINIYLKKQQVVNRKLSCSSNVVFLKLNVSSSEIAIKTKLIENLRDSESCNDSENVINILSSLGIEFRECDTNELKHFDGSNDGVYLSVDRMVPRSHQKFNNCLVSTLIDTNKTSATFYALSDSKNLLPTFDYQLTYSTATRELTLLVDDTAPPETSNWLQFVLFKKIRSWMESCSSDLNQQQVESHRLIDSEAYNDTYARLKEKYGAKLEENWNESTDPKKFIYEDIAIASYLIVLWQQERQQRSSEEEKLQSFADLGCGNGLLVYILSQEGHNGYGIDLRKRKIWDQFPAETILREEAIVPSNETLYGDVDWIIGNHSDELSPWIPVISARSSFTSKYFLLPCCAFEFSGEKYQRKGPKSQYMSFVDYLLEVSSVCGFDNTQLDRLKIPSTKRICLIGSCRSIETSDFQLQCQKIQEFIDSRSNAPAKQGSSEKWSDSFTPREKVEVVRNCSRIDKSLTDFITKVIFEQLLAKETFCDEFPIWNRGTELSLPEAWKLVSKELQLVSKAEDLKKLKSECGGLQTLLRNKSQIFHVYGGVVRIRLPKKEKVFSEKSKKRNVVKTSFCFFFHNHPSGCPLIDTDCTFIH